MNIHAYGFDDEYETMEAWLRQDAPEADQYGPEPRLPDGGLAAHEPGFHTLIADAKLGLASQLGVPAGDIVIIVRA